MRLTPGARIGAYEILGSLGAGGMGEVYRAHDPRLGRDVAVKILPQSMAHDAERLARFTREARAVAALNHPRIVTIFSTEETEGTRFITMELIEGRTLGMFLSVAGDWDRGLPMVRRAMDLDPNHPGVLHIVLFFGSLPQGEYVEALAQAKHINAVEAALVPAGLAAAAGQLERTHEARAAIASLERDYPEYCSDEKVRSVWSFWLRDEELINRLVEGSEKALALVRA